MFPRVHVKDIEKRGPRAPPRNKMALYEQFSIPSQKFNNKAANLEQQFSIPPQRFNHSNNTTANLERPSNQGVANEHDMLLSYQQQPPTGHQSEKPYGQYSDFTFPLTQAVNQRNEDDFRVPIFVQSQECGKYANNLNRPSDPCNFSLNSHETSSLRQQVQSKEFATNPGSSMHCEPRDASADVIDILDDDEAAEEENIMVLDKINSPAPSASNSEVQRGFGDLSGNQDKSPFRSAHSVSETSVLDSISRFNITTDEMVEMIGPKRFWRARKAILNQQRLFALQVFELHRLVKVQKSMAEAPRILADDDKPPLKLPLPRIRRAPSKPKASFPPLQNAALPPIRLPFPLPSVSRQCGIPQGQQWLVPVMTPSEGLVYKPYPGPAFGPPPQQPYYPPAGYYANASASSPTPNVEDDREQAHELPLFPTRPETTSSLRRSTPECPVQVIKVVPHNAISATESAARIFQSIQQDRRQ